VIFKYIKLVLPHVLLVAVVCLYAIAGAWIFYSLESPHEDKLKKIGIQKIGELRNELIQALWMERKELKRNGKMDNWIHVTDVKLQIFAFSKQISINGVLIRKKESIGIFWFTGCYGLANC
ncbi:hypothetical protein LOAG_14042, partial [Loa loa]